jgi:L-threonylcarbamoyladenylate synthase
VQTRRLHAEDPADIAEAVALLRAGRLVALPTETVYGLAARGLDESCVRAIFEAKGRPSDNPVILHVATPADALPLVDADDLTLARARTLMDAFWPGPLTLVLHKSALVPDAVTAGLAKVAVRCPAHAAAVTVLRGVGEPLAAPSANASSRPSPTTAQDVLASLDGRIDAVLDGGACRYGIESTVVDVSEARPLLLRHGAITAAEIAAFLPELAVIGKDADARAASPGLRHRHYAPAIADVRVIDDVGPHWDADAALLCRRADAVGRAPRAAPTEILEDDAVSYARSLFAALYRLERARPTRLLIARVPEHEAFAAVRDRIARAAERG